MTDQHLNKNHWDIIVIGGGQAGLAAGYHLSLTGEDYIILDDQQNTGDSWRKRWQSLRLFTPAWTNGLPGMPFPGDPKAFATKDEMADFLISYKQKYDLPVLYNTIVTRLTKTATGYHIATANNSFYANHVIVATGGYTIPNIPAMATRLNTSIHQIHSSQYVAPQYLPAGNVLVVGAGTSGLQIAIDLAMANRKVYVSGKPPFRIPDFIFKYLGKQFVWFATNILNTGTPMGRKAHRAVKTKGGGAPLINIGLNDVLKAGVIHLPRLHSANKGLPTFQNGEQVQVNNIIWCTGFTPYYSWVQVPGAIDEQGHPVANRGVSAVAEGLYFVGSLFQYGLTSTWIGGVGRDAAFVTDHIRKRKKLNPELP
ncbi:flavin-containing monooxygenase [Mucilaginibacter sp. AW1-3]